MGLLGIVVAVLAFWGYQFFKDSIEHELKQETADQVAKEIDSQLVRVSKELDEKINEVNKEINKVNNEQRHHADKLIGHISTIYSSLQQIYETTGKSCSKNK